VDDVAEKVGLDVPVITGATRIFAMVGDPIAQARSPLSYNRRIAARGGGAVLVPWHAPEALFDTVMSGLMNTANVYGIVITYPFKHRALPLASQLTAVASRVGAVNALRRQADGTWMGAMFDGDGLVRAARSLIPSFAGLRTMLLGAGGAGRAIAYALAEAGVRYLAIYDADGDKAALLVEGVREFFPDCLAEATGPVLDRPDLLINATPVGLSPHDGLPIELGALRPATVVIDIVARCEGTLLLEFARTIGCPHVGGAAMVEGQADIVLDFFGIGELLATNDDAVA
jgi:shikimate dehydrogenase